MARAALFSSSVLSSAASGRRLPTLQVTLAFVAACGGDREHWRRRWLRMPGGGTGTLSAGRHGGPREPVPATPRPAQLPARPRGFVARSLDLRRLGATAGPPVVVYGPFGVGKSEFALHYAHGLATGMPDGHLYADFEPLPAGGRGARIVVGGFLRALGIARENLPSEPDQQAGLLRTLLCERTLVMLLDNVRDEGQVRPLLAETRHCVTVLVSRTALLGLRDVRRVRLGVLSRPDAIAMITAAVPDRAGADREACDRLAELCGDLPLALDIAVRRLIARPEAPLRWAIDRLAQPGVSLDWLRIGDLSVRESLRSAYAQLGEPARVLLRGLLSASGPVVPGPLAQEPAAEDLVAPDPLPPDLVAEDLVEEELTEELTAAGMLRHAERPGTYRLDPLVRAFVDGLG